MAQNVATRLERKDRIVRCVCGAIWHAKPWYPGMSAKEIIARHAKYCDK